MYKRPTYGNSLIIGDKPLEGETIEMKVVRLLENKEPIDDGSPIIYTDRKDGVDPAYNIRTDRFEIAAGIMDKIQRDKIAKTEGTGEPEAKEIKVEFGKPESAPDTASK